MGITAESIRSLGLIDQVVEEPLGGAHSDPEEMARRLREVLAEQVDHLGGHQVEGLLEDRYRRLMALGSFDEEG